MAISEKMVVGPRYTGRLGLATEEVRENGKEIKGPGACSDCGACGCRKYASGIKQNERKRDTGN